MTTHAIIFTILLLYPAHQIASIWHFNNRVPLSCALGNLSRHPLSLSYFSCTLSLSTSRFHLKDHLLDSESSCDFQVSTIWPRVRVLPLSVSVCTTLPFTLNEFILLVLWSVQATTIHQSFFPGTLLTSQNRGRWKKTEFIHFLSIH